MQAPATSAFSLYDYLQNAAVLTVILAFAGYLVTLSLIHI